ncbi:MFS transporter [Kocuria sp.]|uniref:MFS transporter n=1 Tax=Kocuria sp. TaxID=1871328 RepID=UPI0026E034E5|nr:MFS transporter [Kocuria sp.]MDO5617285.1 MFS transporter [Kocuria sp.]
MSAASTSTEQANQVSGVTSRRPRTIRPWLALAALMFPVLTVSVTTTALSFALPDIAADLRPTAAQLLWIVDIYPLILAGLLIPMGTVGDRVGRRLLLIIGSLGFAGASVFGGLATSAEMLIAARVAIAIFGSMLLPATLSLIRVIFDDDAARRTAIAIWTAGFSAGAALGPIVGGALMQVFSWHAAVLVAVPVCLGFALVAPFTLPESKDPRPGKLDIISAFLAILTMTPIVYGIKTLATGGAPLSGAVAMVLGLAVGVIFVLRQNRLASPMVELGLFRSGRFTGGVLVNIMGNLVQFGFLFFITQHLQLVAGLEAFTAGLLIIPGMTLAIIAGLYGARWAGRVGARTVVVTGLVLSASGYLVVAATVNTSVWPMVIAYCVLGVGIGFATTLSTELVVGSVPAEKSGAASAISETGYEVGAVLGTAVVGGLVTGFYQRFLAVPTGIDATSAAAARETLGGAYAVAQNIPGGAELTAAAALAYNQAIAITGLSVGITILAFTALVFWLLRTPRKVMELDTRTGQLTMVPAPGLKD